MEKGSGIYRREAEGAERKQKSKSKIESAELAEATEWAASGRPFAPVGGEGMVLSVCIRVHPWPKNSCSGFRGTPELVEFWDVEIGHGCTRMHTDNGTPGDSRGSITEREGLSVRAWVPIYTAGVVLAGLLSAASAWQQNDAKDPLTFDVASVKPTPPGTQGGVIHQLPGNQTYEIVNAPLRLIMTVAFTVTDRQISGGPEWINSDRWNIQAKADRRGTNDEMHDALARLIEDRFHLKVRHETRELPVYLLTVDKQGVKMTVHDAADLKHDPIAGNPFQGLTGNNVTMNYFAFFLSRGLDSNVLDRTNLTDHYDLKLHYVPEPPPGGFRLNGEAMAVPEGPDLFTALREQLGLRLEKGKGPVDFLVVEHVEKPSDN